MRNRLVHDMVPPFDPAEPTANNGELQAHGDVSDDILVAQSIKSYYEKFAREYAFSIPGSVTGGMQEWLDVLIAGVSCDVPIFEIGSGTGRDASYLESLGFAVQRSEIADAFIRRFEEQGISALKFDVLNDRFPGPQHVVFANSVFCHMTNGQLRKVLDSVHDALVPGGKLGFNTKSAAVCQHAMVQSDHLPGSRYFSYWPASELRVETENAGFEVLWCSEGPAVLRSTPWVNLVLQKRPG
ncbi:class I SAM-dependent methyltransferase [Promicromonospora sp. CA-289599]|uniref:class I SAM-dependent methyltransferase n=1 Tax=Promicromonospora sp. CA-289599 TaxID=3240014 RepID=UPI003D943D87